MTQDTAINQPPKVLLWFKLYCGFLCLLYLACATSSLFFFFADPSDTEMSVTTARIIGVFFLLTGIVLFVICLIPLILAPRPWLWTFDLVVICLGMTSACCLPACIPLLIFWLKPDTKRYFGKS
ncbi:MAG: hypothetical protein SNJ52_04565 [Verrucomicrobiia bacterium]